LKSELVLTIKREDGDDEREWQALQKLMVCNHAERRLQAIEVIVNGSNVTTYRSDNEVRLKFELNRRL